MTRKLLLCLLILLPAAMHAEAQQGSAVVAGIIKSENGEVLNGVFIKAENSINHYTASTTTNEKGLFTFNNLPAGGPYFFVINSIGFLTDTLRGYTAKENGRITLSVVLKTKSQNLDNIVVVGYGKTSRANVTGSVTSVQSEDFNQGVMGSPAQLLQGKVPGLNVTKSGDPNGSAAVILRGPSTLRTNDGAQEPFYVIDGIPGASIEIVAPDDIASIDILKDAASTSIYGARAANGVILITTRKAKSGQTRLAYNAYVGVEKVSNRIEMLSGDELRDYLQKNGKTLAATDNVAGANTNWQQEVQRTGVSHNHNISLGGGTDKTAYYGSVNYFDNEGIMKGSALKRVIIRAGLEQKALNDRLKLSLNIANTTTDQDKIPNEVFENMLKYLPTVPVRKANGTYTEDLSRGYYLNPVSLIDNNIITVKTKTFLASAVAEVKLWKGLQYTLSLATQNQQINQDIYYNSMSGLAPNLGGKASRNATENQKNVLESFFTYDKSFGDHSIKLLGGYSWQEDKNGAGFGVTTQQFVNDLLGYNNLSLSEPPAGTIRFDNTNITPLRLISYYARANYQYANKYLLQVSLRNDGSSAFGKNNQWGYFPSVSAGWRIINESFMQHQTLFSDLKLRVGYGVSGNSLGFDPLIAQARYSAFNGTTPTKYYANGVMLNAYNIVQNPNPDLKWESTSMTNIGIDFSILRNRLSGSIDIYDKNTSDLIWDYPVSTTQYFASTLTANVGKINNKGIELVLNATPVVNQDFSWKTTLTLSHNVNKVTSLSNTRFKLDYANTGFLGGKGQTSNWTQIVKENLPIGTFNIYHYLGKDDKGVTRIQKANGNYNEEPNTTDYIIAGNAQPKLLYGWVNSFKYKHFDLNFFFRGVIGNKILNATLAALNSPSDATLNNIPRFTLDEPYADNKAYLRSDRFIESGSYLRLDNATLGYTIDTHSPSISRLRVYAAANNLFVLTGYKGIDPEINMGGITPGIDFNNFYPKTRSFLLGVNVTF